MLNQSHKGSVLLGRLGLLALGLELSSVQTVTQASYNGVLALFREQFYPHMAANGFEDAQRPGG